jgi:hypothetical protein
MKLVEGFHSVFKFNPCPFRQRIFEGKISTPTEFALQEKPQPSIIFRGHHFGTPRVNGFAFDQPNIAVLYFPFNWLPSCIVPLVLLSHLAAIRQLLYDEGERSNG